MPVDDVKLKAIADTHEGSFRRKVIDILDLPFFGTRDDQIFEEMRRLKDYSQTSGRRLVDA
jgi:hypothetical protein